jgi:NADPH-dependent 2,4-dienoyl-CoA reductase/sulfur reductase-like enzyme/rhodanese-related sulfurtransferase
MSLKVVVIGGVAAGAKAAVRIARRDPEAEVTVLEKGEYISYAACGFPFFISDEVKEHKHLLSTPIGIIRDSAYFKKVKGVTVYTKTLAEEIDRESKLVKTVHTETGERKEFPYDKLVLSTGGSPVVPSVEGINLNHIYNLWRVEDALAIKNNITRENVKRAVVIGGGLIGMEMVEAFNRWGIEVTVVEMLGWVLPKIIDRDFGLFIGRYLEDSGIRIHTLEKVLRFEGDAKGNVRKVVTDKNELETDMVLMAIGVRPNVEPARKAGIVLGATGAIQVNEYLQTSDPDIYAGGDCVENTHRISGKKVYTPMGSTANKHGRVIADHITGGAFPFSGVLGTGICKVLDLNIARTGLSEGESRSEGFSVETVICPSPDRPHYYPGSKSIITKLVADKKTGRLLGAQIIGPGDVAKRIDIVATALSFGATVEDVAMLDLAYAPPFSLAMDNIITAAHIMDNKIKGLAKSVSPLVVKEKLDRGDDFIFLDVRSAGEYEMVRIEQPNVLLLPLGKVREEYKSLPNDKEIITFCGASLRGYEAQRILEAKGFKNVKFMDGGISAWPFEKFVRGT